MLSVGLLVFFFFSYFVINLFNKKLLVLILLEIMFMVSIYMMLFSFLQSDSLNLYLSLILMTFTVLDSVFGVSLLVDSSRNSYVFGGFFSEF